MRNEATLTVHARRCTLNVTVKTLDLSWEAVLSQDEKPLHAKILPRLAAGGFAHLRLTRET